MPPQLWVVKEIKTKAIGLLQSGSTRDAVEILLQNDLSFQATEPIQPTPDLFDAGEMLAKALAVLSQAPHTALGVPIGADVSFFLTYFAYSRNFIVYFAYYRHQRSEKRIKRWH